MSDKPCKTCRWWGRDADSNGAGLCRNLTTTWEFTTADSTCGSHDPMAEKPGKTCGGCKWWRQDKTMGLLMGRCGCVDQPLKITSADVEACDHYGKNTCEMCDHWLISDSRTQGLCCRDGVFHATVPNGSCDNYKRRAKPPGHKPHDVNKAKSQPGSNCGTCKWWNFTQMDDTRLVGACGHLETIVDETYHDFCCGWYEFRGRVEPVVVEPEKSPVEERESKPVVRIFLRDLPERLLRPGIEMRPIDGGQEFSGQQIGDGELAIGVSSSRPVDVRFELPNGGAITVPIKGAS